MVARAAAHGDALPQLAVRIVDVLRHARLRVQDAGAGRAHRGVARLLAHVAAQVVAVFGELHLRLVRQPRDPVGELRLRQLLGRAQPGDVVELTDVQQRLRQQAEAGGRTAVAVLGHAAFGAHHEAQPRVRVVHVARGDRIARGLRAGAIRIGDAVARLCQHLVERAEGARRRVADRIALERCGCRGCRSRRSRRCCCGSVMPTRLPAASYRNVVDRPAPAHRRRQDLGQLTRRPVVPIRPDLAIAVRDRGAVRLGAVGERQLCGGRAAVIRDGAHPAGGVVGEGHAGAVALRHARDAGARIVVAVVRDEAAPAGAPPSVGVRCLVTVVSRPWLS